MPWANTSYPLSPLILAQAYNMLIMEKNGFKQSFVIKCMLLANVTGTLNPISVAFMHCVGMQPTSSLLRVLICIAINLALSDTLTYASHRLLHQHPLIAPAHILHHCCRAPNVTSALVFHPIDLIIEFGVPVTTSNLMSLLVWQDPWICFFSAIVHHVSLTVFVCVRDLFLLTLKSICRRGMCLTTTNFSTCPMCSTTASCRACTRHMPTSTP